MLLSYSNWLIHDMCRLCASAARVFMLSISSSSDSMNSQPSNERLGSSPTTPLNPTSSDSISTMSRSKWCKIFATVNSSVSLESQTISPTQGRCVGDGNIFRIQPPELPSSCSKKISTMTVAIPVNLLVKEY